MDGDKSFFSKLSSRCLEVNSLICVGLDPHSTDLEKYRAKLENGNNLEESVVATEFCKRLVNETKHLAAAYKPNAAFFEALGEGGFKALKDVIDYIPDNIPVVLDNKRGDISSTAEAYATASYDKFKASCVTLHPYMGYDSIKPFVEKTESSGAFVLCKTSNPSSKDFETLSLNDGGFLYERIAKKCSEWNDGCGNIGLVVGATDVVAMERTRKVAPQLWILAPGVGFQGGNLEETVSKGLRMDGLGLLIPISRGISRADSPKDAIENFSKQVNDTRTKFLENASEESKSKKGKIETNNIEQYQIDFFKLSLKCGVLRFGDFTLKSGRKSPYFFNAGLYNTGSALADLGRFYAECIVKNKLEYDVIFGPAYKGIPLAAIIAASLYRDFNIDKPFAYNRKEAKDHGEGGLLVGASVKGKKVLVVDDVITAGTAIRESINILAKESATVSGVVIALDRQEKTGKEGALENISAIQAVKKEFGFDVASIVALDDLLSFLSKISTQSSDNDNKDSLKAVKAYREKYGTTTL